MQSRLRSQESADTIQGFMDRKYSERSMVSQDTSEELVVATASRPHSPVQAVKIPLPRATVKKVPRYGRKTAPHRH